MDFVLFEPVFMKCYLASDLQIATLTPFQILTFSFSFT